MVALMSMNQGPLHGIRVLSIGHWIAGPYAATLLADLGADVTRVVPPGSQPAQNATDAVLARGSVRVLELDLRSRSDAERARALASETDVMIENFRPGVLAGWGLAPTELVAEFPRLVVLSLPGFASDDPRAAMPGWEGVIMASAGAYGAASAEMLGGEWWPSHGHGFSPLPLASVFAGALGALAVTGALIDRERSGRGQLVEVSLHDAFLEAIGSRGAQYERPARNWTFMGSGFYRCADDTHLSLITVWHRHLRWFLSALGWSDARIEREARYETLMASADARERLRDELTTVLATRPAKHWEKLGFRAGVPVAELRTSRDWLQREAAQRSGSITRVETAAGTQWMPGPPVRIEQTAAGTPLRPQRRQSDRPGPLAGFRILDMTRVLAGPTASRLLADLGADVVRADVDPSQIQAGHREPFFHEVVNRGKRIAEVDLRGSAGPGRRDALLGWADALITNFTSPALERLGIDAVTLGRTQPELVHTHVTSFDEAGEWSHVRGYAEVVNTVTGLTAETLPLPIPSGVAPNVDVPRMPFTDHLSGIFAAVGTVAALLGRVRAGHSSRVTTALVDAAYAEQLPYVGDAWAEWRARAEPMLPGWSPSHRMIRTAEGWIFIGLGGSAWTRLTDRIGGGTRETVEAAFLARNTGEAIELVTAIGGAAHPVVQVDSLGAPDSPLRERGLLVTVDSPEFGRIVQLGNPIRYSRTPVRPGAHPDAGDEWLTEHVGIAGRQSADTASRD